MGRVRGKDWIKEHVADSYVKRARAEGMRSRSAYKLDEIAGRDRLLAPGMIVVDLGAAPGGWSQVAAERVGARGRVIALDVLEMRGLPGVIFIRGDFHDVKAVEELERALVHDGPRQWIWFMTQNPTLFPLLAFRQIRQYASDIGVVNHMEPADTASLTGLTVFSIGRIVIKRLHCQH